LEIQIVKLLSLENEFVSGIFKEPCWISCTTFLTFYHTKKDKGGRAGDKLSLSLFSFLFFFNKNKKRVCC